MTKERSSDGREGGLVHWIRLKAFVRRLLVAKYADTRNLCWIPLPDEFSTQNKHRANACSWILCNNGHPCHISDFFVIQALENRWPNADPLFKLHVLAIFVLSALVMICISDFQCDIMFDTDKFICEIQQHPSICDTSSKSYSNRIQKAKDWHEICLLFVPNFEQLEAKDKNNEGNLLIFIRIMKSAIQNHWFCILIFVWPK